MRPSSINTHIKLKLMKFLYFDFYIKSYRTLAVLKPASA